MNLTWRGKKVFSNSSQQITPALAFLSGGREGGGEEGGALAAERHYCPPLFISAELREGKQGVITKNWAMVLPPSCPCQGLASIFGWMDGLKDGWRLTNRCRHAYDDMDDMLFFHCKHS